jgi:hypothetical protein
MLAPAPAEIPIDAGESVAVEVEVEIVEGVTVTVTAVAVADAPAEVRDRDARDVAALAADCDDRIARLLMVQVLGDAVLDVEAGSPTFPVSGSTKYNWLLSQRPLSKAKVLLPHAVRWTPAISHAA